MVFLLPQVQFFPQGINININDTGVIVKINIPYLLYNFDTFTDFPLFLKQILQQIKFPLREVYFQIILKNLMGFPIKRNVSYGK